jgi:hypothetical protein
MSLPGKHYPVADRRAVNVAGRSDRCVRITAMGIVALAAGLTMLTAAAIFVAASLRLPTAVDAALASYLTFGALAIAIALVLSPFHGLTVLGLLLGAFCALALSVAAWASRGRPGLPLGGVVGTARDVLRDPPVLILASAVALALAYAAALSLATPANNFDSLRYHLARAAFWKQEHAIEHIADANDARLNVFPPASEIMSAWAMVLEGSERYASLFQLLALLATIVAAAGIARRLGLTARQAAFGALLFASLPVVALQSSTPLTDVVLCSYVVTAVYFVLSRSRPALALGALALALAVATKATAFLALPLVAVAAAVVRPRAEWLRIAAYGAAALVIGGFWYAVNLVETGDPMPDFGEQEERPGEASGQGTNVLGRLTRTIVDVVDPSGAVGRDRYVYLVIAVALVVAGVTLALRTRSARRAFVLVAAAAVALVPLALPSLHDRLLRAHQRLWLELGDPGTAFIGFEGDATIPSPFNSWYGPVGLIVFFAAAPVVVAAIRSGRLGRNAIAFLAAPVWYLVVIVLALGYHLGQGRYLMPAVALSAATWGVLVDVRPLAWSAVGIGVAALLLAFVHYGEKPAGIAVLGGSSPESVWEAPRERILRAAHVPGPFRAVEEHIAPGDSVALRLRQDDVSYPYFGAALDRRVTLVSEERVARLADVDWFVVAPGLSVPCPEAWTELPSGVAGWRILHRKPSVMMPRRCDLPS